MSTVVQTPQRLAFYGNRQFTRVINESVKFCSIQGMGSYSVLKGPTDSIGTTTVTLTNVVIGSAIRIEAASTGALVEARTAVRPGPRHEGDTTTEVFTLPVYDASNPANDLRIKVRKGSASPFFMPFESLAVLTPAAQSVYVSQIPDE